MEVFLTYMNLYFNVTPDQKLIPKDKVMSVLSFFAYVLSKREQNYRLLDSFYIKVQYLLKQMPVTTTVFYYR